MTTAGGGLQLTHRNAASFHGRDRSKLRHCKTMPCTVGRTAQAVAWWANLASARGDECEEEGATAWAWAWAVGSRCYASAGT